MTTSTSDSIVATGVSITTAWWAWMANPMWQPIATLIAILAGIMAIISWALKIREQILRVRREARALEEDA